MPITKPVIPFYAAVGAGDALVEKVRTTDPSQLKAPKLKAPSVKAPQLPDVKEIPAHLKAFPEHLRELQEQAQTFATDTLGQLSTAYTDFAKRGESVVEDVRKHDVVSDVKDAVSKLPGVARTAPVADEPTPVARPAEAAPADKPAADKPAAKSTTKSTTAKSSTTKPAAKKSTTAKSTTSKKTAAKKPATKASNAKKATSQGAASNNDQ